MYFVCSIIFFNFSTLTSHKRNVVLLTVEENSAVDVKRVYRVAIDSTLQNIMIAFTAFDIKYLNMKNASGMRKIRH